jgi:hypothetical protein
MGKASICSTMSLGLNTVAIGFSSRCHIPMVGLGSRRDGRLQGSTVSQVTQSGASSPLRLKLPEGLGARWHTGTAHVLSDDDPRARQRWLAGQLPSSAANAAAVRLFGTELLTVRIDLDG